MSKKSKIYILSIVLFGLILIVGTYAWFTWRSSDSRLVLTVGEIDDAQVILKPYQINKEIIPVLTYEGEEYIDVYAVNKNTDKKRIILYYHINNIDSELISENFKYTILRSVDNGNTYTEYISGNFSNTSSDSDLYILNERIETNTNYKYKIYLWLDGSSSGQGNIQGKSFDGELRAEILDGKIYANLGGTTDYYKADTYREKITKVEFVNNMDIPSGSITFELGESPSKSTDVMGWLEDGGNDTYTLKIGANDKIYAKGLYYAFYNMTNLKEITFDNLDTSETTNMEGMFQECSSLTSLDLSSFNTSNVVDMLGMFYNCSSLTTLNLSSFNTSKVTNMYAMFAGMSNIQTLNISDFNTSKVENMALLFYNCTSLTTLDLSKWNTSKVTNMYAMFNGCSGLTSLNLSNFDTSNVVNMGLMFCYCRNLLTINVSSFNTSNVTDMTHMFNECFKITSLDVSSFDTSKVTNMYGMFANCPVLTNIYVSDKWNTSLVSDSTYMFANSVRLPNYNSSSVDKTNAHYNTGGYLTYKAA